jgi:hypothetical protein
MRGRDEAEAEAEDVWKYLLLGESTCAGGTDQPIRGATVTRRKVSRSHRRPISFNPWIPPPILTLTILTTVPLSLSLVPFIAFYFLCFLLVPLCSSTGQCFCIDVVPCRYDAVRPPINPQTRMGRAVVQWPEIGPAGANRGPDRPRGTHQVTGSTWYGHYRIDCLPLGL